MVSEKREITMQEVSRHSKPDDLWVVIHDKVYDLTKFRKEHPGGEEPLDEVGGREATKEFDDVGHSRTAKQMMRKYHIGNLAESDRKGSSKVKPRDIGIAVGAVVLGFTVVYLIKRFAYTKT